MRLACRGYGLLSDTLRQPLHPTITNCFVLRHGALSARRNGAFSRQASERATKTRGEQPGGARKDNSTFSLLCLLRTMLLKVARKLTCREREVRNGGRYIGGEREIHGMCFHSALTFLPPPTFLFFFSYFFPSFGVRMCVCVHTSWWVTSFLMSFFSCTFACKLTLLYLAVLVALSWVSECFTNVNVIVCFFTGILGSSSFLS